MNTHRLGRAGIAAMILTLAPAPAATADGAHGHDGPSLAGRAVLPVGTYAPGPPSGSGLVPVGQTEVAINGIHFPTPSQPVEGFSAIIAGRRPGNYLVMPDNGFGGKANSRDFLIRAYYIDPRLQDRERRVRFRGRWQLHPVRRPRRRDRVPDRPRGDG